MREKKFYLLCITILIALNVGTLLYPYLKHPKPSHPFHQKEGPKNIIIKELSFDKKQQSAYQILIKEHQHSIREKEKERFQLKSQLYTLLTQESINPEQKENFLKALLENQKEIETIHFAHFEAIKSLCTSKNQLIRFNHLSKRFPAFFAPPSVRPLKPRHH